MKEYFYSSLSTEQLQALVELSVRITPIRNKEALLSIMNDDIAELLGFDAFNIALSFAEGSKRDYYLNNLPFFTSEELQLPFYADEKSSISRDIYHNQLIERPLIYNLAEVMKHSKPAAYLNFCWQYGIKKLIASPFKVNNTAKGVFWMHFKEKKSFKSQSQLMSVVTAYIAAAVSNIIASEKIENQLLEMKLLESKFIKEHDDRSQEWSAFKTLGEMEGSSSALKGVLELIQQVAFSDTTVLITGETGTGKELVAKALHFSSPRKTGSLVKVNCAAIPASLIESELFGHEKGSFTGAIEKRIGKFELANNGTLFLDEIGELPIELQVKLLRAIQEKEIERVGGRETIKTNVRVIAATNRNLEKEVAEGRFRHDLYYRLNVFPIFLPALRHRKEDIPLLAARFISEISKKCGKAVNNLSPHALQQLMSYDWPGNVRELEHLIERSILLTRGSTIKEVALPRPPKKSDNFSGGTAVKTLSEVERDYILTVLKKTAGKIHGPGGAAEMLKLPPTTLASKIKKLGIKKRHE